MSVTIEGIMMLQAVEGIYRNGTIELLEVPQQIEESRVLVTFLTPAKVKESVMLRFGMFGGEPKSTEEDFAIAEFHEDFEDDLK
jgi:hypothetical protein